MYKLIYLSKFILFGNFEKVYFNVVKSSYNKQKKNQSLAKSSLMMTRNESVPKSSNKSTKGNKINHLKESSKNKAKGNVSKPTVAKVSSLENSLYANTTLV